MSHSLIRFGQINLGKRIDATAELNRRTEYDVVLITEPQVTRESERVAGLETGGGHIIALNKGKPRACIRTNLESWKKEDLTDRDLAVALVKTNEGQLCVASLYLDINLDVRHEGLVKLVRFCKQNNLPLIIGADSNAHSGMW